MKLNILISHTSTKTLRLQIHLKLFKEAFWSWQETSWGLLTGYLVDNLKSAFLTFTNIKNINHQQGFFVNLDYYFKVILRLTLLYRLSLHVDGNSQFNQPNWTKETSIYWKIRWELEKLFLIFLCCIYEFWYKSFLYCTEVQCKNGPFLGGSRAGIGNFFLLLE